MEKKPTHAQIKLCEACIMQEAYIETIRPIVSGIYNEVLHYWFPEGHLKDKHSNEPITDHEQLYRYDGECGPYYEEADKVLRERGYAPAKEGCCPLLEAECTLRDTQAEFVKACVEALPPQVTLSFEELKKARLEHWQKFIEINMSYVVQFVDQDKLRNMGRA